MVDPVVDAGGAVTAELGGGPFNAARTIGRLESDVAFLGAIWRDRLGTLLHRQLLADELDDSLVPVHRLAIHVGGGRARRAAQPRITSTVAAWWDQSGLGRHDLNDQNALRAAVAAKVAAVSCTRVGARPLQRGELSDMWSPTRS